EAGIVATEQQRLGAVAREPVADLQLAQRHSRAAQILNAEARFDGIVRRQRVSSSVLQSQCRAGCSWHWRARGCGGRRGIRYAARPAWTFGWTRIGWDECTAGRQ